MYPRTITSTGSISSFRTSIERPDSIPAYARTSAGICSTSAVIRWCFSPSSRSRWRSQKTVSWLRILPFPGTPFFMITSNADSRSVETTSRRSSSTWYRSRTLPRPSNFRPFSSPAESRHGPDALSSCHVASGDGGAASVMLYGFATREARERWREPALHGSTSFTVYLRTHADARGEHRAAARSVR